MDGGNILAPDRDAMRAMLARLAAPYGDDPGGGLFEIASIRHDAHRVTARHFAAGDVDGMAEFAASLNAGGAAVYVGAALRRDAPPEGRAKTAHVAATRWLWLDYDDADAAARGPATLEAAGLTPAFVVVTGTTPGLRLQVWLALAEPCAPDVASALMRKLAAATDADAAPTDAPRIMRLAGGVAWPKPGKPGRVAELVAMRDGAGRALTLAEVERAVAALTPAAPAAPVSSDAPAPAGRADGGVFASLLASLRASDAIGATGGDAEYGRAAAAAECAALRLVGEGGRNHALNRAAYRLGQLTPHLLTPETARAMLLDAAAAAGLTESESRATVASGLGDGAGNPRHPECPGSTCSTTATATGGATFGADVAAEAPASAARVLAPAPFVLTDGSDIPRREWLYGRHLIRGFVSATVSPGGVGKSSLGIVEALAMATGRPLLGDRPAGALRVWLWNGEDPADEMRRRVTAAARFHGVTPAELAGRLFVQSGRDAPIKLAQASRDGPTINAQAIRDLIDHAKAHGVDVLSFDPFVSLHSVPENDNGAIDAVVKALGSVAEEARVAIELVHHSRKPPGGAGAVTTTVDDARGAGALIAATRSARTLNRMTKEEADGFGIPVAECWRYVRVDSGKSNMSPPGDTATWRQLASVELPNGSGLASGDDVGAVAAWTPPDAFDGVTADLARRARSAVLAADRENGEARADAQATLWAGWIVADVLGLDRANPATKGRCKKLIANWLANRVLVETKGRDPEKRRKVTAITAGPCVPGDAGEPS